MADYFLDSSVVIGLVFRHAGERTACSRALRGSGQTICSRYVVFEVARGFLRSLITLYNSSFEYGSFADLHRSAHSGQKRFQPYAMHTWLGAFDDYFAALEAEDGSSTEALKLEEFRAKLRGWIRRGWSRMHKQFQLINKIGCRDDLPAPFVRGDQRIDQRLPTEECGRPSACKLQAFVAMRQTQVEAVCDGLEALSISHKDKETLARIEGLRHLLSTPINKSFVGRMCYHCGDAFICLEAPSDCRIVTKNEKHFKVLVQILSKQLDVVVAASSNKAPATRTE